MIFQIIFHQEFKFHFERTVGGPLLFDMNSQNLTDQVVRIGEPCEPSRHHQFSKMLKCAIDEVSL